MNERQGEGADDPIGATLLGLSLLAVAALETLVIGWNVLIYGIFPLLGSRGRELGWIGGFLFQQWAMAMMVLAKVFAGGGLLFRESWARPWVVWTSLATLFWFVWTLYNFGEPFSDPWKDFLRAPGIFTLPRAVVVMAAPLVAGLALLLITVRGGDWLPPSSRAQWIAAALIVVLLNAAQLGQIW